MYDALLLRFAFVFLAHLKIVLIFMGKKKERNSIKSKNFITKSGANGMKVYKLKKNLVREQHSLSNINVDNGEKKKTLNEEERGKPHISSK